MDRITNFRDPAGEMGNMLPRLGKIGLGVKVASTKPGGGDYPRDVDYFVLDDPSCRPIIQACLDGELGEKCKIDRDMANKWRTGMAGPKVLPVMFTSPNPADVAPKALEMWGKGQCRCRGDGMNHAWRADGTGVDAKMVECNECPCDDFENGKCKRVMRLMVMIPAVDISGCWQIDTGSRASISSIEQDLLYIQTLFGSFSGLVDPDTGVPLLRMAREPWTSSRSKVTHYRITIKPIQLKLPRFVELKRALESTPLFSPRLALPGPEQPRSSAAENYLDGTRARTLRPGEGTPTVQASEPETAEPDVIDVATEPSEPFREEAAEFFAEGDDPQAPAAVNPVDDVPPIEEPAGEGDEGWF